MVVRNEANRYLRRVLEKARMYIDEAVIIDDASTDRTPEICQEVLQNVKLHLIKNSVSKFGNEVLLRKQQWEETIKTNPQWILNLDADEMFENKFKHEVKNLIAMPNADAFFFRLYDFWSEKHYRSDRFWCAHQAYRWLFLLRYQPDAPVRWPDSAQHCGRFPILPFQCPKKSSLRIKHYGWANEEDRLAKYNRYKKLDPDAKYGWKEQYESILDLNPNLIVWLE
ncbi:MAG: Glycosyltransferase involved in cell wall biosis [Parachlamydiales bacterium]|nr:Glycosyltransferase involved in cell wall biosis [Parachlamydiales bacterium]